MLQFLIDEINQHNQKWMNDFADNYFKFELLDTNALSVKIKKKTYKVIYIEREAIFTIHLKNVEVAAIEAIEDVVLFLLA